MASQTIDLDAGAIEYTFPVTINGNVDISSDTIQVALGTYDTPGTWVAPDQISRPTTQSAVVQMLIGTTTRPAEGYWWLWTLVQDNPERVPRRTTLRLRVINSGSVTLNYPA